MYIYKCKEIIGNGGCLVLDISLIIFKRKFERRRRHRTSKYLISPQKEKLSTLVLVVAEHYLIKFECNDICRFRGIVEYIVAYTIS